MTPRFEFSINHLLGVGVFSTSLGCTVFQHTLGVDDAISVMDGVNGLIRETATAQTDKVHTGVANGLLACYHIWRNILTGT